MLLLIKRLKSHPGVKISQKVIRLKVFLNGEITTEVNMSKIYEKADHKCMMFMHVIIYKRKNDFERRLPLRKLIDPCR